MWEADIERQMNISLSECTKRQSVGDPLQITIFVVMTPDCWDVTSESKNLDLT